MAGAKPGVGYSILAQILAGPRHKAVITTNFDNLVADALATYTDTFPLVCGHKSLASFVRTRLRRPLVAKVHGDLLLAPQSTPEQTDALDPRWADALRKLLCEFTPVVVGYGGNDGSLMGFLEDLEAGTLAGGIYWCYWAPGGVPNHRIKAFVARHHGRLVPISDFDEFMLQANDRLGWAPLTETLQAKQQRELERYKTAFEQLNRKIRRSEPEGGTVRQALDETIAREKSWWQWQLRADAEPDPLRRDAIFRQGLDQFPESAGLAGNYANFLTEVRKDHDKAEQLYKKALELEPNNAINLGNFANFLTRVRKDHDRAELLYRKALELDRDNAVNVGNYAVFLTKVRKDHDQAEQLYRKALALDPNSVIKLGNYANFLTRVRKDHDQAEQLYRKALELDPNNAINVGNYAVFLTDVRKNHDQAEQLCKKALALDPDNAINVGNYANLLTTVRKNHEQAEQLYKKALELDPDNPINVGNYATFLTRVRKNHDQAEQLYKKALELDPSNATNVGNYAGFLTDVRKDHDQAERFYKEALVLDPNSPINVGNYAAFLTDVRKNHDQAEQLYKRALELDPGDANYPSNYAALLLEVARGEEALSLLRRAWQLNQSQPRQVAAEVALYWSLLARLSSSDASPGIGRARYLLEAGYDRSLWSFDPVLEATRAALPPGEDQFFSALAAAILDPGKVPALAAFPQWQSAKPIPITEPWDLAV